MGKMKMNWYKLAQFAPIAIVSYNNTYEELGISFNGDKKYTYTNINPYTYNKIKKLLDHKNYREAAIFLRKLTPIQ
jgi:hypothetical protein